MADTRTVLHALPEDQPDSLGKGTSSNSVHGKASAASKPSESDPKGDWQDYAQAQGVDTDGMTKAEIIDTVGG